MAGEMLATIASATLVGIDAVPVDVEVDVASGLPGYHVVGLPAPSVKEGSVRIRGALEQVGHGLPHRKITVNLAPADIRKAGAAFDLPIAIGVLGGDEVFALDPLHDLLIVGELGLDGTLRKIRGALAAAMLARQRGMRGILLPEASAAEAEVVEGIDVFVAAHLGEVLAVLNGKGALRRPGRRAMLRAVSSDVDMADVRGQEVARAAIEVAVAGGHNVFMSGPPGIGKTMLARRIPTILPPMSHDEALETSKVYSAVGLGDGLIRERPFRAPHHTISTAALLGGGSIPRPGEISLAHNGVLFLDELPEFSRVAIESLRQPLEDRRITIGRIGGTVQLPASVLLVASANPCPCGWLSSGIKQCTCSQQSMDRYRARLSGPLLDRMDMQLYVRSVALVDLRREQAAESSAVIRDRVLEARARQGHRLKRFAARTNAEMSNAALRATCRLDDKGEQVLAELHRIRKTMTARGVDRLLRVARTVADVLQKDAVDADCLREAVTYRALDQAS